MGEKLNIQIGDLIREMTAAEQKDFIDANPVSENPQAKLEAQATNRASALAKLKALGLTEAEIAAL
jgi:hypothetical protein